MDKKKGKNYKKNKKSFPIYYGVHLQIEEERKLLEAAKKSIEIINTNYKEDFISMYETISELIKRYDEAKKGNEENNRQNCIIEVNKMKYPKSFHITIAFGGNKGFDYNSEEVKGFIKGLKVDIKLLGLIVVPNKMVLTPVQADFKTKNEFTHITTFVGDLRPVQSNEILEGLFSKGMEMEEDYKKIIEGKIEECVKKIKVKIEGKEFDAFVHLNNKIEKIKGTMKEYYD